MLRIFLPSLTLILILLCFLFISSKFPQIHKPPPYENSANGNRITKKRDIRKTKEIIQICVDKYLGLKKPDNRIKLDYFHCGKALDLVHSSILYHRELTSDTIVEIEDVPNHSFRFVTFCPPADEVCYRTPLPEEIVLVEEDRQVFSSTMNDCVGLFFELPIGFANYTNEQFYRSDVLWCCQLFDTIRHPTEIYGKLTLSYVVDMKNHLEKKELLRQNIIKSYYIDLEELLWPKMHGPDPLPS